MEYQLDLSELYLTTLDQSKLEALRALCIDEDLLDLDAYNSIDRADKIQAAWDGLKVIEKILKL